MSMTRAYANEQPVQNPIFSGSRCIVEFDDDPGVKHRATMVRDDLVAPYIRIFHLDSGRYVLGTEIDHCFIG